MIPVLPWRLIGAGALVAAVMVAGWRVNTWHDSHKALKATEKRLSLEESCGEGSKCRAREAKLREEVEGEKAKVVEGLAQELAAVSGRPPRVVRLRCSASGSDVRGTNAPGDTDGGTSASGELSAETGFAVDVEALYQLAKDADEQVALRRALIQWNKAISAVK